MPRLSRVPRRRILLLALLGLGACGCGGTSSSSSSSGPEVALDRTELLEIGEMYQIFLNDEKKPPRATKDVLKYATAFTYGSMALQEGRVVVLWGVDLQPDSTEVLAYGAKAPEAGGAVLLRDGLTVKTLTAPEFEAAGKAPGKAEERAASKARKARSG